MAERRMFSKRLINSARFLKMPVSTQALYFHLGLHADDDGVVEAYTVMHSIGACEDDLKVLVAKGFVNVLNEDLVTYITDWNENNKIRADRKIDSIYKDLLIQVLPDIKLLQKKQRADTKQKLIEQHGQPMDNQRTTNGQPMDNQWTAQVRLGKDSIGKDSISKDINIAPPNKIEQEQENTFIKIPLNDNTEFSISTDMVNEFKNLYPIVDIEQELRSYRGWTISNPEKRKTKRGIMRSINRWLSNKQDKGSWVRKEQTTNNQQNKVPDKYSVNKDYSGGWD